MELNSVSKTLSALLVVSLLHAVLQGFSVANAQTPTQTTIVPNRAYNLGVLINTNEDTVMFRGEAGNCYCCEIFTVTAGATANFLSSVQIFPNIIETPITVTARLAGGDAPQLPVEAGRICFAVPSTVPFPLVVASIQASTTPVFANVSCDETTLYSGFNTSVTDFNFLEMTNTLDTATTGGLSARNITASVTATNTVPAVDTTVINNQSFTLPAGSRVDVDIHSAAGNGAFGPVKICHNGAPGSVKAAVAQYNITSTAPLDFEPVARDEALTRGALAGVHR